MAKNAIKKPEKTVKLSEIEKMAKMNQKSPLISRLNLPNSQQNSSNITAYKSKNIRRRSVRDVRRLS